MNRLIALLCVALLSMAPVATRAEPTRSLRPDERLVIGGSTVFALSYALPLGLAFRFEQPELAVPVLGPLIDLHRCNHCTGSAVESGIIATLVLDTALQSVGVVLFTLGMLRRPRGRLPQAAAPGSN